KASFAGPMTLSWLANTTQGRMVGDYISTSFSSGAAFLVFMVATAPTGSTFHEAAFTVTPGLAARSGRSTSTGDPILSTTSSSASLLPLIHTSGIRIATGKDGTAILYPHSPAILP